MKICEHAETAPQNLFPHGHRQSLYLAATGKSVALRGSVSTVFSLFLILFSPDIVEGWWYALQNKLELLETGFHDEHQKYMLTLILFNI